MSEVISRGSCPPLAEPWAKTGDRNCWRALTANGLLLTVSRSVDGTWAANVDYPGGLFDRPADSARNLRTRLIAQGWAERMAAKRAKA